MFIVFSSIVCELHNLVLPFPDIYIWKCCLRLPSGHFPDIQWGGQVRENVAQLYLPTVLEWTQNRSKRISVPWDRDGYVDVYKYISPPTVWQIFSALAEQTLHRHQVSWPHLPLQYLHLCHEDICSAGILGSSTHTFPLNKSLPTVSWALRTSGTTPRVEISTCWADLHRSGLFFRLEGCCFLMLWSSTIGCTQLLVSLQSYK